MHHHGIAGEENDLRTRILLGGVHFRIRGTNPVSRAEISRSAAAR
jgi:hypothetical protein